MLDVIPEIVTRHAEDAAFLWLVRDRLARPSPYSLIELTTFDRRVEAHLDGLRIAGESGWRIAHETLGPDDAGEVFVLAGLAFEGEDEERVHQVLTAGTASPAMARGVVSALGWLPSARAAGPIRQLLAAESPVPRRVGIAAAAAHRRNPGLPALQAAFSSGDPPLASRALRAVGELGLVDLHITTRANLKAEDPTTRYWAAWSTALIRGYPEAVAYLQYVAETGGPFAGPAAAMAMRRLPARDAKVWLKRLVKDLSRMRIAVDAAGALGDPEVIPFLIDRMRDPALARLAGDSFSLITGAEIAREHLNAEKPEGFEAGPNDDPDDENVAMDPDENLPWPDPALVQKWWGSREGDFANGTRYLLGQPVAPESLLRALKTGRQRQRSAAALERAIIEPGRPLFEVRAPGFRQRELLG